MANPSLRLHKAARRLGSRKRIISMPYRVDIPEGIEALDHILNHLGTNKLVESRKRMFRIIYDAPETSLSPREREAMRFPLTAMMGCPLCHSMRMWRDWPGFSDPQIEDVYYAYAGANNAAGPGYAARASLVHDVVECLTNVTTGEKGDNEH